MKRDGILKKREIWKGLGKKDGRYDKNCIKMMKEAWENPEAMRENTNAKVNSVLAHNELPRGS